MTLICFASQKGSPGATAAALAVTASLKMANGRRKVLLEADTTGGTLAIRYRLPVEPGLLTLAAAVRGGLDNSEGLWRHAQELPGGLPVIVCPDGPEQVHAAMAAGGAQLGRFLNGLRDVDVMCDVGRLSPDSPALPFVAEASAVLMVARPTAEQLQPAARRMLMLRPLVSNLGWVLVGQKPYGPADVETTYDFPVVGVMADDPRSVQLLERGTVSKRLRRQPFIRSATTLADTLAGWLSPLIAAPVIEQPGQPPETDAEPEVGIEAPELEKRDLSLLPPPTGEPDTTTPSPLAADTNQPLVEDALVEEAPDEETLDEEAGEDVVERSDDHDTDTAPPETDTDVVADWDPPVAPDDASVPALVSAPLFPPPDQPVDNNLEVVGPSDETDPFPTEVMRPVPPPPAPSGSRPEGHDDQDQDEGHDDQDHDDEDQHEDDVDTPVSVTGATGFTALAEPGGLGWADLEPMLPGAVPPLPPSPVNENGSPVLDGAPPVPPPSLSLQLAPPEPPRNGSPPAPPASLALDQRNGHGTDAKAALAQNDVENDADDWDGSEFTITADLTNVFAAPDFDAPPIDEPRTEPPMPPMATVPPLPPPSTQLTADLDAEDDRQTPPSPFPHEDSGADWTGW